MSARGGAVVLHGLTGTPASVSGVAVALASAGFAVEVPVLPGHGTTPEDLAECGWDDWVGAAKKAYAALDGSVVVVGLSMGGSLATALAASHPQVAGLVAINPIIDPPAGSFQSLLGELLAAGEHVLPGIGGDIADADAVETAYDRLPVAALRSMGEGLHALRPRLVDVRCPVLLFTSRQDHVVHPVSSDVLADAVSGPVERVWLERSYHGATLDLERHEIERLTVAFAERLTGS